VGKLHSERCGACKDNIYLFLSRIDGNVERQYDLGLPAHPSDYRGVSCFAPLELIYEKLQDYRGYGSFVRVDKLPKVDYYLPTRRLVVEFDESQHFTGSRLVSLSHYPSGLSLGYDRRKWMDLSRRLDMKDNDPPYRDEQRAWYDTLRDFSSVVLGNQPTVRLYAGDRQWCLLDADNAEEVALFQFLCLGDRIVSSSSWA
jgi:hypothetical protein